MNNIVRLLLLLVTVGCVAARAESANLTNADAARLFAALRSTQSGTTALNTRNGALNINVLRPVVEAYEMGQSVIARKGNAIAANDPDRLHKIDSLNAEALALTKAPNAVNLTLFTLSDEEIRDAKVPMDSLAEFLRFLTPTSTPPAKK